jgi:ribosomal protein L22
VTPANPQDPQTGKPFEDEQAAQDAKDAAAETTDVKAEAKPPSEPKAEKEPKAAEAEGTAAEQTGVDKAGAEAAAVTEPAGQAAAEPQETGDERSEAHEAAAPATPKRKPAAAKSETQAPSRSGPGENPTRKPRRARGAKADGEAAEPATNPSRTRRRGRQSGDLVIVRAQAKYVRSSPRKARLVCDHIRGKSVAEARSILAFHPRAVAEAWSKLLESAVANAENNHDLVGEDLKIHAVFADAGPTIKRFRPRAMGRATPIRKRTSHLTIQLTPKDS